MPRVQSYVNDEALEIQKKTHEQQCSIFQVIDKAIVKGLNETENSSSLFHTKKTHTLLSYILCSVYDKDTVKSKNEAVCSLIDNIEEAIRKKPGEINKKTNCFHNFKKICISEIMYYISDDGNKQE